MFNRQWKADVRDALAPQGVMVANMVGPKAERAAHLQMIADVFADNIMVLPVENDGNYLVFAFRDAAFEPRWRWIESQAKAMQKRYGLDFASLSAKVSRFSLVPIGRRSAYFDLLSITGNCLS